MTVRLSNGPFAAICALPQLARLKASPQTTSALALDVMLSDHTYPRAWYDHGYRVSADS